MSRPTFGIVISIPAHDYVPLFFSLSSPGTQVQGRDGADPLYCVTGIVSPGDCLCDRVTFLADGSRGTRSRVNSEPEQDAPSKTRAGVNRLWPRTRHYTTQSSRTTSLLHLSVEWTSVPPRFPVRNRPRVVVWGWSEESDLVLSPRCPERHRGAGRPGSVSRSETTPPSPKKEGRRPVAGGKHRRSRER